MKNKNLLYIVIGGVVLCLLVAAHLFNFAGMIKQIHGG
jgi:hypothetical protein